MVKKRTRHSSIQLKKPVEYHYIADFYNWDDDIKVLGWIINSPICERATAQMIFWRSQPSFYTRFLTKEEAGRDAEIFLLLRKITWNMHNGFYRNRRIYYDPGADKAAEARDYRDAKAKWEVPEFLKEVTRGWMVVEF